MKSLFFFCILSLNTLAFNVDKNDVGSMIDQMVAKGIISKTDGEKAKKDMGKMTASQWSEVNEKGRALANKQGAKNKNVDLSVDSAASNIDFDSAEFKKIQEMMGKTINP